jgi:hypothetical protein
VADAGTASFTSPEAPRRRAAPRCGAVPGYSQLRSRATRAAACREVLPVFDIADDR